MAAHAGDAGLALSLGDVQFGEHRGVEYQIEDLTVLEVLCRGQLARSAALHLEVDQPVVVLGTLHLSKPIESWHDQDLVRVTLEAETIGVDLARLMLDGAVDAESPRDAADDPLLLTGANVPAGR